MKKASFVQRAFNPRLLTLAIAIIGISLGSEASTTTVTVAALNMGSPGNVWTDTGVAVVAGQAVTISATGEWNWGGGANNGPDGIVSYPGTFGDEFGSFNVSGANLVGFIGSDPCQGNCGNSTFFPQTSGYLNVGSGITFIAPYAGELWLGINDDSIAGFGDNSGQLQATITVGAGDTTGPKITISAPSTVYVQNGNVKAVYSCTDPDDAVASCAGYENGGPADGTPVANGSLVDTSGGPHLFTVVATDSSGNTSSARTVYSAAPDNGFSLQSLVFAPQFVGSKSPAQKVKFYNVAAATQTGISNFIAISGAGFSYTTTCGTSLAAHSSCSISVAFKPTAAGEFQATLGAGSDQGCCKSIPLVGFGTLAKLSPAKLTFAAQTVGTTSTPKNVTLKNAQTVSLNISSVNLTGDFGLAPSTTCPTSGALAAGKSCVMAITFAPTQTGTRTGTLIVQADYPIAPVVVSFVGTGQ